MPSAKKKHRQPAVKISGLQEDKETTVVGSEAPLTGKIVTVKNATRQKLGLCYTVNGEPHSTNLLGHKACAIEDDGTLRTQLQGLLNSGTILINNN